MARQRLDIRIAQATGLHLWCPIIGIHAAVAAWCQNAVRIEAIFNVQDQIPAGSGGLVGCMHRMNPQSERKHSGRKKGFQQLVVTAPGSIVFSGFVSVAAHNAYHLDRIVVLRQLHQAWPPVSGGFSW